MNSDTKNKVCFEIAGKPAVVRVIENLKKCGVCKFIVVVGSKAESVMDAVSGIDGITFVYQKEQSGTGNAAMCALKALNQMGVDGPVLTVMGDKLIEESVFQKLIDDFYNNDSDISLITQPIDYNPSGGRIVVSDDKVVGIVEHLDLLLLQIKEGIRAGKTIDQMFSLLDIKDNYRKKLENKLSKITNPSDECFIEINGKKFTSSDIISSKMVNCATYLHKRDAINESVNDLSSDNAQNEIYFTDTIMKVAKNGKVSYVKICEKNDIHTFNTPDELNDINNYFSSAKQNS